MKLLSTTITILSIISSLFRLVLSSIPPSNLHYEALHYLATVPESYRGAPLYNDDNIDGNLYIPQYNTTINNYNTPNERKVPEVVEKFVIPLLEEAAAQGYHKSLIMLADFYTFGNYSVETSYSKALEYYQKAVDIKGDGHAYFMLGYMYSTGMFGEVDVDPAKAHLYYQMGMEHGDNNAILALAYRSLYGIGTPKSCDMSLHYYTRLAHLGKQVFNEKRELGESDDDLMYNIKIVDFNGGLYGNKLSESPASFYSKSKIYSKNKDTFDEYNLDLDDHEYINLYYSGVNYYGGDYFFPKNFTKAFEYIKECVELGEHRYAKFDKNGKKSYKPINSIDVVYLSRCQALLGHMFLEGQGVDQNFDSARTWLHTSLKVQETAEALNDLAFMAEKELGGEQRDVDKVIKRYHRAVELDSPDARLNLAKFLISLSPNQDPTLGEFKKEIYENMGRAVYGGNAEALYYYGDFLQSGLQSMVDPEKIQNCPSTVVYYKIFIERLERVFLPHLKYAFQELIYGNYKNALLGYSIAAEQGLLHAQISAAYLLFQLQPLLDHHPKKTFPQPRLQSAIRYFEMASSQDNVDATLLLGDLFSTGLDNSNISKDYNRAFSYYKKAASQRSSHGAYKLGHMYEYGLGPVNNTVDFFMAKRYYDSSLEFKIASDKRKGVSSNKIPINWALLRLRLKYLFNRDKFKNQTEAQDQSGWFNAFKKISNREENKISSERANAKANAHHEGTAFMEDVEYQEEYDVADYFVIFLTFAFFVVFFVQNVLRQARRMRNNNQANRPNEREGNQEQENPDAPQQEEQQPRNGIVNGFQWNFRRGNAEFHFFAI
ncbi:responsible for ER-associated degradation of numerous ER-resident protein [Scheffersomyces xylosifermentans]|uniref:responsible for ER-associated degradation of numerous ER-resident protein n=1 Tax=Scheffersomyces xylosifermentans TaxID=1304137 RepID=UPI00315D4F42